MGERIDVSLRNLVIWSDNPRIANQRAESEQIAIELTYEIVGVSKMNTLAEDIGLYGLNQNTLPVVVPNCSQPGKYDVYDGNRRIIILKQFADNTDKVINIPHRTDYTHDSSITVYCTNVEEALRLMDLEHAGELDGKGRIAWESYQRDIAFARRNIQCQYPTAYEISRICRLSRKSDYADIPYTDLEYLFNNAIIKGLFDVKDWDFLNEDYIRYVYTKLKNKKPRRIPYSRYLPRLNTNQQEVDAFKRQLFDQPAAPVFLVSLDRSRGFLDEGFSVNWISISRDGEKFDVLNASVQYYINGEISTCVNKIGTWSVVIIVDGYRFELRYTVLPYCEKVLRLKEGPIFKYNSLHYNELIEQASNSKGQNCIDKIALEFETDVDYINNPVNKTLTFNQTGAVEVKASYIDDFTGEISVTQFIKITTKVLHAGPIVIEDLFLKQSIINETLNFSPLINTIINKLDDLYKVNDYTEIIVSSLRCVIELVLEEISKYFIFTNIGDLQLTLKELYGVFRDINYKNRLAIAYERPRNTIKNIIDQYTDNNLEALAAFLHLGAHKNTKYIDVSLLNEKLSLISLILELAHTYIKFKLNGAI